MEAFRIAMRIWTVRVGLSLLKGRGSLKLFTT
jgi:hypothetical protein